MKIEVVIDPKLFNILPHQMVSTSQFSIVWEPINNPFVWWWLSYYVDKEMYKEPHTSFVGKFKKNYKSNPTRALEKLKSQTLYIRSIIHEINSFLEPKDYFPIKPEDINLKFNKESKQMLNDIHRHFVRIHYPTTKYNPRDYAHPPRRVAPHSQTWRYNWYMDRCDYDLDDPYKEYPNDFTLVDPTQSHAWVDIVLKLNDACHDIEHYYYQRSNKAKNFPDLIEYELLPKLSKKWGNKWYEIPKDAMSTARRQDTIDSIISNAKRKKQQTIPDDLFKWQSSDTTIDVWLPQNCVLGKNPTIAYMDDDDATQFDIHNGHQADFGFAFTNRKDREIIRKEGFSGNIPYGWPLGRIVEGRDVLDKIKELYLNQDYVYKHKLKLGDINIKEIKIWK